MSMTEKGEIGKVEIESNQILSQIKTARMSTRPA